MIEPVLTDDPHMTALEIYEKAMAEQKLNIIFFGGTKNEAVTESNVKNFSTRKLSLDSTSSRRIMS